jgi:hypothetical protein
MFSGGYVGLKREWRRCHSPLFQATGAGIVPDLELMDNVDCHGVAFRRKDNKQAKAGREKDL